MERKTFTAEAIALGMQMGAQAQGDVAKARRAAGDAYGWLCSIDPTWREPVQATAAADQSEIDRLRQALTERTAARDLLRDEVRDLTEAVEREGALVGELQRELASVRASLASVQTAARAPTPAPMAAVAAPVAVPVAIVTPAPVAKPVAKPAPVATVDAVDPYIDMPPAMREWARKRAEAAAARALEID